MEMSKIGVLPLFQGAVDLLIHKMTVTINKC